MADINRDMDKYLRGRRSGRSSRESGPSWWDSIFSPKPRELPGEELTPVEMEKLKTMETDLKRTEKRIETIKEVEHELEEEQEQKVGFYHQLRKLFTRSPEAADDEETLAVATSAPAPDAGVTEDFRKLAAIQMRWLDRLPSRIKDEFKESDDYQAYVDILQRRGVAKKR